MSELVFSTVLFELKKSWRDTVADPDLIELLYDAVALPVSLTNNNGNAITVSKGTASKIVNRQKGGNPLKAIRASSSDQRVLTTINDYFRNSVVKRLLVGSEDDLLHRLKEIINNDSDIAIERKKDLLSLAQKNTLAEVLASVFLYSLTRDNVVSAAAQTMTDAEKEAYKHRQLQVVPTPANIESYEKTYADALMEAYGQTESIKRFDVSMLPSHPVHQQHFSEQRGYYFAAEAVRRGTRDIYGDNDPDQFEVLKEETFEGVKEVWEENYKDGLTRLRRVMTQASNTRVDRCWLTKDTDWIGNPQKKGVCHFLVNEDKLKGWVREDDEQAI